MSEGVTTYFCIYLELLGCAGYLTVSAAFKSHPICSLGVGIGQKNEQSKKLFI